MSQSNIHHLRYPASLLSARGLAPYARAEPHHIGWQRLGLSKLGPITLPDQIERELEHIAPRIEVTMPRPSRKPAPGESKLGWGIARHIATSRLRPGL
jgi:hypothetical protein